jgi:hypothetical protein
MELFSFEQRVEQITDQIRASDPLIGAEIQCSRKLEMAEWERGQFRATLTLHRDEAPPRLALQLYTGEDEHPAPLQIGFYETDVINMIAVPSLRSLPVAVKASRVGCHHMRWRQSLSNDRIRKSKASCDMRTSRRSFRSSIEST